MSTGTRSPLDYAAVLVDRATGYGITATEDRVTGANQKPTSQPATAASAPAFVAVDVRKRDEGIWDVYATSTEAFDYAWVEISFTSFENVKSSQTPPIFQVLAPKAELRLATIEKIDKTQTTQFKPSSVSGLGDPTVTRTSTSYVLPYPVGEAYTCAQGFKGAATHTGASTYATDFTMPEGSTVTAARGGVVVQVKEDSDRGGDSAKYEKDTNYVRVLHSDRTYGLYAHLQKDGAAVSVGDSVKAGDVIGLSGKTGYAKGPHLHFAVEVATRTGYTSVTHTFVDGVGLPIDIKEGESYRRD